MGETHAFIARSAKCPLKVAALKLHDHSMRMGIGWILKRGRDADREMIPPNESRRPTGP